MIYSCIGALLPDIIEATYGISFPGRWEEGKRIFPWHKPINNKKMVSKRETMKFSLIVFCLSL